MSEKLYEIKAYAQDPESLKSRTEYANRILRDIETKEYLDNIQQTLGSNLYSTENPEDLPQNKEELELHMQLDYKQSVEIAEEELINNTLDRNRYELTRRRINEDLVILGIGCTKTSFNKAEGITVDYVDPARLVYSYTEDPNFEDIWYVGEVKRISLSDLKQEFPNLTPDELEKYRSIQETVIICLTGRVEMTIIVCMFYTLNTKRIVNKYLK
eukprot:TRINITY_DN1359_c0_g1_i1.p1 TRINITY_DN1359_c0_g1~~TRINITY_DN1359_c0_g1_i1.p1  ORF type:complete len:214 (-),score=33.56 TRINITY_DN1359_c0_g1_i1:16-657(-)